MLVIVYLYIGWAAFIQLELQVTQTKTVFIYTLPIAQTTFAFILLHLQTTLTTFDFILLDKK